MEREWKQYSQSVLRNVVSKNCQFVMLLDPLETQWMQSAQINCEAILKMHLWLQLLDCCCMLTVVICVMVGGPNWLMMLLHSIKWVFIYMWKLVFLYFCNAFSVISFFCQKSKLLKIYRIQSLVSACKQNRVSFIMYLHRRNWGDSEHADIENRALAAWSTAFQYLRMKVTWAHLHCPRTPGEGDCFLAVSVALHPSEGCRIQLYCQRTDSERNELASKKVFTCVFFFSDRCCHFLACMCGCTRLSKGMEK